MVPMNKINLNWVFLLVWILWQLMKHHKYPSENVFSEIQMVICLFMSNVYLILPENSRVKTGNEEWFKNTTTDSYKYQRIKVTYLIGK